MYLYFNSPICAKNFSLTSLRIKSSLRNLSSLSDEHILKRSDLKTDVFQNSLPILKVPKLDDTIRRYLRSQEALLTEKQFLDTKESIETFASHEGKQLQQELNDYAAARPNSSYITEMWTDMYLKDRKAVVLNHQPVLIFNDSLKGSQYNNQAVRSTNLIYSMLRFKNSLSQNILAPEVYFMDPKTADSSLMKRLVQITPSSYKAYASYLFKGFPLDMSQYKNLFCSTRIPNPTLDELKVDKKAKHILVIRNGNMYYFDVMDASGRLFSGEEILKNITFILNQPNFTKSPSSDPDQSPNVGVLTAMTRDKGYEARKALVKMGNKNNFDIIDSAVFAVVLNDTDYVNEEMILDEFLAGPAENRWFDKSISLLVDRNGRAAFTFEHSWGDGVAILRLFNETYNDSESRPVVHSPIEVLQSEDVNASKIIWNMTGEFHKSTIQSEIEKYNNWRNDQDLKLFEIENRITRDTCKVAKLSPDSMIQLAFQIAYYKVHQSYAPTYESCSTSVFKHGRTETLRSGTIETRKVVDEVKLKKINEMSPDLWNLLKQCSAHHNVLTKEAAMGQGWDRHLFALKVLAQQKEKMPDFFAKDYGYNWANNIILSTSSLNSDHCFMGGFASPNLNGYGIGYSVKKNKSGVVISTWKSSESTKGKLFAEALHETIDDLGKFIVDMKRPKD